MGNCYCKVTKNGETKEYSCANCCIPVKKTTNTTKTTKNNQVSTTPYAGRPSPAYINNSPVIEL